MPEPILYCAAGYFCRRNASSATPDQGNDANICPVGHYCPEGTGEPVNCPVGKYGNDTGVCCDVTCPITLLIFVLYLTDEVRNYSVLTNC